MASLWFRFCKSNWDDSIVLTCATSTRILNCADPTPRYGERGWENVSLPLRFFDARPPGIDCASIVPNWLAPITRYKGVAFGTQSTHCKFWGQNCFNRLGFNRAQFYNSHVWSYSCPFQNLGIFFQYVRAWDQWPKFIFLTHPIANFDVETILSNWNSIVLPSFAIGLARFQDLGTFFHEQSSSHQHCFHWEFRSRNGLNQLHFN